MAHAIKWETEEIYKKYTASSEWVIKAIPYDGPNFRCDDEACLVFLTGIPLFTAVVSLPIVAIGNTINYVEKVILCD